MNIAVVGGGAAGFFSAIHAKEAHPYANVVLFEKSNKVLSKVRISGGGRCNVTNGCSDITELCKAYPRGGLSLKKAFHVFNPRDTKAWFESRGVPLYTQEDGRVFPVSDNSQSVIDCFFREIKRLKINVELNTAVKGLEPASGGITLHFVDNRHPSSLFEKVIVATGGAPREKGLAWLQSLGHKIEPPVPSLFTFNMPSESITRLMGVVATNTLVSIQGTKLKSEGPLLITHWGMSGPAILKLSAFGARILAERAYHFKISVNWVNETNNDAVSGLLKSIEHNHAKKMMNNVSPYALPKKLWTYMLERIEVPGEKQWGEAGKKGLNKLVNLLTNDVYDVEGKTSFKEEFVTCGGVSLKSINLGSMESKVCKNLYFAGEILDIDAITGGYNFQAAWTTGFIAGKLS